MAWKIELTPEVQKNLKKLGTVEAKRILKFLYQRLLTMENPRELGKPLAGQTLAGLWRYRVGDYRILCQLDDDIITILVVHIAHRREVYQIH